MNATSLRGAMFAAAILIPGLVWAQAEGDTVHQRSGTPIRGTLTAMSPDQVTINTTAGPRDVAVSEIQFVVYQDEPNDLASARRNIFQKNWNQADQDLKKVVPTADMREVVKQDIAYFKALSAAKMAMGEGGDKKAAETLMLDFVKAGGSSNYHFYESAEVLGDLAMSRGDYPAASKYYTSIINRATKWPEAQMRATLADGRAQFGQKDYAAATKRFDEVLASGTAGPVADGLKMMANVAKASADAESGNAPAAITTLEGIIEKNDPKDAELFSRTYVALGRAYEKAGKPKDAILAFLAVDTLYFAEADAHAEALAHLTKLWEQINRADRALQARSTLKERYAGSIWAQQ